MARQQGQAGPTWKQMLPCRGGGEGAEQLSRADWPLPPVGPLPLAAQTWPSHQPQQASLCPNGAWASSPSLRPAQITASPALPEQPSPFCSSPETPPSELGSLLPPHRTPLL